MAGKDSLIGQIQAKRDEIAKLEAELEALRVAALPQYPKHIKVPIPPHVDGPRTITVTVNSEEEEREALSKPIHDEVQAARRDKGK